jgi:hypothetical protein
MKRILAFLTAFLITSSVFGQTVIQSGVVTRGHVPYWASSGAIGDGGGSADGPITSFGVTNNGGAGICVSSDRQADAGRNQLCFGASTSGAAVISLQNYGTALPQPLNFVINGVTIAFPTGVIVGTTLATESGPFVTGHASCFSNTSGNLVDCGFLGVAFGGTGAGTAAGARTNLGLGTISTQNANAVAITGGTITGLPAPSLPADAAPKSYVDAIATGFVVLPSSALATTTVLPNSPTYSNGASGVGATLTAGSNTTLTVDGAVGTSNQVVLVKNQAAAAQNGIYTLTTVGSGAAPWVLTRATYFNQASNMLIGSYTFVTGGLANINSSWVLTGTVTTVGTTAVNFNQFSVSNGGVVAIYPQGRLTLTSGTPVMASSVAGATTVYYTGYAGQNVPIYNGASVQTYALCAANTAGACEISVALGSNWLTNSNYDWFVALNGTTAALCSGPAWTSDTARGTGAGTTQLQQFSGLNTNAVSITCNTSNSTSIAVAANQATYVGTMRTGSAGQTNYIFGTSSAGGTAGLFGLWNAYNRIQVKTTVTDINGSFTPYSSATIHPLDGSTTNRVSFVQGLAEDGVGIQLQVRSAVPVSTFWRVGVALDSTNTIDKQALIASSAAATVNSPMVVRNEYNPQLGFHFAQAVEQGDGTNAVTSNGAADEGFFVELSM